MDFLVTIEHRVTINIELMSNLNLEPRGASIMSNLSRFYLIAHTSPTIWLQDWDMKGDQM